MKVSVKKHSIRGVEKWVVVQWLNGKRFCQVCPTELEANTKADQLLHPPANGNGNGYSASVPFEDLPETEKRRIVNEYAARFADPTPANGPLLDAVINELVRAKEKAGRAKAYTQSLEYILGDFSKGREAQRFAAVTLGDVESYLDAKSIESRSTLRARLSTLFKFGIKRGLRPDNPCNGLETVTVRHAPPQILSSQEVKSCLDWLAGDHKSGAIHSPWFNYRHALVWFVLSTACGLRPEEAEQIRRENIHIEEGWIAISEEITKVGMRRVVNPRPEAMALLARVMPFAKWPLGHESKRHAIRKLRRALGWKTWPKDVTRHTAASNWLGAGATAGEVSEQLGNSPDVLKRRYKALRTRQQSEEFWHLIATWEMTVTIKDKK